MKIDSLLLGVSLTALAVPAAAQTTTTQQGTTTPVVVQTAPSTARTTVAPDTDLRQAFVAAYTGNPELLAERANLRATDENVPIARAQGLPTASASVGYSENLYDTNFNGFSPIRRASVGVNLSMRVFDGGFVRNSVRAAKARIAVGQSNLRTTEANIFLGVVSAYMDVIRDEAIVALNRQNVNVLGVNLRATRDRFEVGDLTRTDVAQSEARLALAEGQLRSAEARLISSRESYVRVVGEAPGVLAPPPPLPNLPSDTTAAVETALAENPSVDAAAQSAEAFGYDVRVARSTRSPSVSVGSTNSYFNNLQSGGLNIGGSGIAPINDGLSNGASVTLSVPLFQGGAPAARVRQAQARQSAALETVIATERSIIAQTRSAFANYSSTQRVVASSRVAVSANQLSLEGVRAENSVGTRTILDILNAEQELLNSQVQLVTAERDTYVAGFTLLAAMGRAEAEDMGLDGGLLYNPNTNYDRVKNRWSDWNDDPAPTAVGTPTRNVPAQGAEVKSNSLDPLLQRPVDTTRTNP
jgi:outer membrane protein